MPRITKSALRETNTGHPLTKEEADFIEYYIQTGNKAESYKRAYIYKNKKPDKHGNYKLTDAEKTKVKNANQHAMHIFIKDYIAEEIRYRRDKEFAANMGTSKEVMEFFFRAMRGEIKDQFGLDPTLGDRIKAANELAKRTVDLDNRLDGKADQVVEIKLDWKR